MITCRVCQKDTGSLSPTCMWCEEIVKKNPEVILNYTVRARARLIDSDFFTTARIVHKEMKLILNQDSVKSSVVWFDVDNLNL